MKENIFNLWNIEKQKINNKKGGVYINQREVWFTKMGQNIGFEENGKDNFLRPVLVIKKIGNLFFTVALTTKGKENNYFYYRLKDIELENPKHINSSYLILSQVKVMGKRRFFKKVGTISNKELCIVKKKLKKIIL